MSRATRLLGFTALSSAFLCALVASPAAAGEITITSGSLVWTDPVATLSLAGERGFTLNAVGDVSGGVFMPWEQCSVPACVAGTPVNLGALWSGNDLPGTATLDSVTYPHLGSLNTGFGSAQVNFSGTVTAPPSTSPDIVSVAAPFLFRGLFLHPAGSGLDITESLTGSGTAFVTFQRDRFFPDAWSPTHVVYEFQDPLATPEPASCVLLGTGLALGALRLRSARRGRRAAGRPA